MGIIGRMASYYRDAWREALKPPPEPPKYRLRPDQHGTYTLDKWNPSVQLYLCESVKQTKESADEVIKNLERDVIYYREDK